MQLTQALEVIHQLEAARYSYQHAMSILSFDGATIAPKQSWRGRGEAMGFLSGELYRQTVRPEVAEALNTVLSSGEADPRERRRAELLREELDDLTLMPMEEFVAYQKLLTEADAVWHEAKEKSDYPMFAPYLARLIDYQRRFAQRKSPDRAPYDTLLDTYEKGVSMATLDPFFALLRQELTPLIRAVAEKPQPECGFLHQRYPVALQRQLSERLMAMMGIDRERCAIAETEHPFTDGVNRWDVRITTHYHEEDVASSMYSVIHEGGHALYELDVADELQMTALGGGASMGIHESQSRFYENIIGRSRPFLGAVLPVLRELFPQQLAGVDAEGLYRAMNIARPSLIRTEADELTYPMHVMIRYELEKRMIAGDLGVEELPAQWRELYRRYLGVEPACDREGALQDSHWSGGAFGYFPSYALGSAYGAQMLRAMEQTVDVWGAASRGDLTPITAWLGEKIHRHGNLLTPAQLLQSAGAAPFDPQVYVTYLRDKFTDLYQL